MRLDREARAARRRHRQKAGRRRSTVLIALVVGIPLFLLGFTGVMVSLGLRAVAAVEQDLPSLADKGEVTLAQTSTIYASDGTLLAYLHGVENRTVINTDEIPDTLRKAIVAIEDSRFYKHHGVDFESVVRAFATDIQSGRVDQGSSTITMQLVGNLYLDRTDKSFTRKFDEMALAWQYEKKYTKTQILDMYLNTVYYGSGAYGIETAARTYFDKSPSQLTLAEAALLAGTVQLPGSNSPRVDLAKSRARRDVVLEKMLEQGYINYSQYQQAIAEPIKLTATSVYTQVQDPYVVDYVRKQLISMFGQDRVFKGGLKVETTINPTYQKLATNSIKSTLDRRNDPSAAIVSIEPSTGYIRAMVSSSDYSSVKLNYATQAVRQPGSAFKTFALTAAIEAGINPWTTYYSSQPVSLWYPGATKPWNVTTYGHTYLGHVSLVKATLASDNTVYAQLALDVGASHIADVARRMGITTPINEDPAIALGGLYRGVTPLEMASAYATLANGGQHIEPTIITKVTDSTGKVVWQANPKKTQAISAGVAYDVTRILQMNVQSGTGTKAAIGRPAAGKTGTAQDWANAWFVGYTPHLATAVWMGYPNKNISMTNVHGIRVTGGSFPAIMWHNFMYTADRYYAYSVFTRPSVLATYNSSFKSKYAVQPTTTTTAVTTTTLVPGSTTTTTNKPTTTTTSTTGSPTTT